MYALYRRRLPARAEPPDRTERWLGAVGVGGTTALLGAVALTPPEPYDLSVYALPIGVVLIPLAAVVCYGVDPRTLGSAAS